MALLNDVNPCAQVASANPEFTAPGRRSGGHPGASLVIQVHKPPAARNTGSHGRRPAAGDDPPGVLDGPRPSLFVAMREETGTLHRPGLVRAALTVLATSVAATL